MSDETTGQGVNVLIDRRTLLLLLGAVSGCLGFEDDPPENVEGENDQREDEVTITRSDSEDSGEEPVSEKQLSASELITAHIRALEGKGYQSALTVTDEVAGERVEKEIGYGETADRAEMFIEEGSTVEDGVSSIRYEETNSGSETIVELDSGEVLNTDIESTASQVDTPVRITGASVYKEFLMGATLTTVDTESEAGNEESDSVAGTYRVTGHSRLSVVDGEVRISTDNVIELFNIIWEDDGFESEVMVEMTEIGSM